MGNHFNDLIERNKIGDTYLNETSFVTADQESLIDEFIDKASTQAICFYAGDFEEVAGLSSIHELSRLPYKYCWIELDSHKEGANMIMGALCLETDDGGYYAHIWIRNKFKKWCFWFMYKSLNGKSYVNRCGLRLKDSFFQNIIHNINAFLSAMHCGNIKKIENTPSDKIQKARAKRGKKPLFSYWTLELDLPKSKEVGADLGGTHASPRLHLRRGHPRQYAPGKYCWVQPCVVGNKKLGMIHKDYAVNYRHAA